MRAMRVLSECRLYGFVDTAYLEGRSAADLARQLCDGGVDILQLRAKRETIPEIRQLAEAILPVTRAAGVPLVINDHAHIARAIGASFCHLGQEDFFEKGYRTASEVLPWESGVSLGLSSHSPQQAQRAARAGASYLGIGPVFATSTKPEATPVTLDFVRWAATNMHTPWFAIGGITLENLDEILAAGARRICVISAILKAPNVVRACQDFRNRLTSAA
jgi:thiamine-phosphate pyrophosphorylase